MSKFVAAAFIAMFTLIALGFPYIAFFCLLHFVLGVSTIVAIAVTIIGWFLL